MSEYTGFENAEQIEFFELESFLNLSLYPWISEQTSGIAAE